jgi:hypothetical protein
MKLKIHNPLIRSTIAVVLASTSVKAATVAYFGADPSAAARETWRTAASNTYDLDQNNQYGTAGYAMLATSTNTYEYSQAVADPFTESTSSPVLITPYVSTPSYITVGNQSSFIWQWGAYYDDVQNPDNTATLTNSGLAGVNGTRTANLFTLTFGALTPPSIRLGLYTGSGDTAYTVTANGGSNATMPSVGDFRFGFFDLTGIQSGDSIQISAVRTGGNNDVQFSGYTLDVIPEPSAAILLGVGALGLLGRRRR